MAAGFFSWTRTVFNSKRNDRERERGRVSETKNVVERKGKEGKWRHSRREREREREAGRGRKEGGGGGGGGTDR